MAENQWENFGEEIRKTVQNAVEHQNYDQLNEMISDTINQAVNTVAKNMKSAASATQKAYSGYKTYTTDWERDRERAVSKEEKMPNVIREQSKASSFFAMTLGFSFSVIWMIMFLAFYVAGSLIFDTGFYIGSLFFGVAAAVSLLIGIFGTKKFMKIRRFGKYVKAIGTKEYCNISDLAGKIGKSDKYVLRDVTDMIRNHWFLQGHLDEQKTCLMITDRMYAQYRQLEEQKALKEEKAVREKLPAEVQKVIDQGEEYLCRIRRCNDEILGEEISLKINRIETLVDNIFDRVKKEPKYVADIRKLMEYYLPTTVKLLEAYAQMDAQPTGGENIQTAKKEIENTLDTLNIAFEKLLDSLFLETAWDVSSDVSVLNTLLAQEGLKEDSLKK